MTEFAYDPFPDSLVGDRIIRVERVEREVTGGSTSAVAVDAVKVDECARILTEYSAPPPFLLFSQTI